ncbi:MAG: STAS domain-containing protein [Candidatus Sumerlaeia bacterium]|nr:STAS domain-containing protein [Candidatus Sumerlaeia bacterium]
MELTIEGNRTRVTVSVRGRLTGRNCEDLRAAAASAVEERRQIALDLGGVTEVDEALVGLLVEVRALAEAQGGNLVIESPSACVLEALRESGLDGLFGLG